MRGDDFSNIWFNYEAETFDACVMACVNNIVLIDRRKLAPNIKIQPGDRGPYLAYTGGPFKWAVYDQSPGHVGEWQAYKTRKAAITEFVRKAMSVHAMFRLPYPKLLDGTVAEGEWKSREAYLADVQSG
jgi:hypothetical protein